MLDKVGTMRTSRVMKMTARGIPGGSGDFSRMNDALAIIGRAGKRLKLW
jgi:hypothetical protein